MPERYTDILVVDLLGGIGDLVMTLPVIHGLARHNPGAALRLVTHPPGDVLVDNDPAVTEVHTPRDDRPGAGRRAVELAIAQRKPDLAVTTTRHDRIPELLEASGARCVTDLWRRPPADELVTSRYLRILRDEGLLDVGDLRPPRLHLSAADRAAGHRTLADALVTLPPQPPVILATDAGMAVKRWPDRHWEHFVRLVAGAGHPVLGLAPARFAPAFPSLDLRRLAACFAAVGDRGGVVVGGDTGPLRVAAAAGASTVALFGPTLAARYGLGQPDGGQLQGLPACPHRNPTSITEQVCWWDAGCPLSAAEPACMADISPAEVATMVLGMARRQS
jgi:ADP-heptose:LPS heptosyltransferase